MSKYCTQLILTSLFCATASLSFISCSENESNASEKKHTPNEKNISETDSSSSDGAKHEYISADTPISFNGHIQPILSANCYHCHGPDSGSREPKKDPYRLDTEEGAFETRKNGKAHIIKGDPDNSYLVKLIESDDPNKVMPLHPSRSPHGKIMDPADIALIRRWVKEGANFEKHWAYISPKKATLPKVKDAKWVRNPIDNFVLSRLEKNNLTPNPEEGKARLLRRLTFDLTGLPPTAEEVTHLLADKRNFETVYAEKVDQLLKTDAYAEHYARHWLDVARYADTHGIHNDNYRSIWPYRDWVINAFRKNMKFDQFTIEQIAGDMLPNATLEQKIASGFHRCLPTTGEGGAIADEYFAIYAQDRVDTTSAAWLGLTAGCAACHDHKFDAISTKENYELTAFFRNTTMAALDRNNKNHPPNLLVPHINDRKRLAEVKAAIPIQKTKKDKIQVEHDSSLRTWVKQIQNDKTSSSEVAKGAIINLPLNDKEKTSSYTIVGNDKSLNWKQTQLGDSLIFSDSNGINLGNIGNFDNKDKFSFAAWIYTPKNASGTIVSKTTATADKRGYDLSIINNKLVFRLINELPKELLKTTTHKKIKAGSWNHVTVSYEGKQRPRGIKIHVNGVKQKLVFARKALKKTIKNNAPLILGNNLSNNSLRNGSIQHFQLYNRVLTQEEINKIIVLAKIRTTKGDAAVAIAKPYYFSYISKAAKSIHTKLVALNKELKEIRKRSTHTLIMDVKPKSKPTAHVLIRGEYSNKGKEVLSPNVPSSLPPMTNNMPKNRIGLGMWLTDKNNPLPARVTANRYWYYLFGQGIVETNKDFGVMGARPTHPKLLDYLAADFMEHDWDLHHLLRQIVTSSTYRQNSVLNAKKKLRDPLNKLLSRGPRYRLDAEQIRDLALRSSNLLHTEIGGPSVKPYQPINIWESVAMKGSDTRHYKQDSGTKLYRRSIYTFLKRTAHHPTMEILNAPNREESCVQRELTNTPLQAFVIMNDPQFVEASRLIATNAIKNASSTEERINFISMTLISRKMTVDEINIVKTTLNNVLDKYKAAPKEAAKLIKVGTTVAPKDTNKPELAAWTIIANQILNMDETLNK